MKIESKFVYVNHKEDFKPLISTIPEGLNPIVFIEDTREIWTCGTYFNIGYPTLTVTEDNNSIIISIGNSQLTLSTSGEGLSLSKGEGNSVVINSNALTKVNTSSPLEWTSDNKLIHKTSGATAGSYGSLDITSNTLQMPNIEVNDTGHITSIENSDINIKLFTQTI